ncbi:hypothetical protein C4D60_Mb03t20030 [Musa balbisiana]|uniref:Uncharacterized protein n=1 Tax=Musa balbisiana TaxID=52838 RepID=A0A4S8JBI9_MUSBA|nr:hypothetical protein C4D60_Mb03t20030 [Musa balbisiana]
MFIEDAEADEMVVAFTKNFIKHHKGISCTQATRPEVAAINPCVLAKAIKATSLHGHHKPYIEKNSLYL